MQYYIKFFNTKTNELVGYYKDTGTNRISKLMNGIKYFNSLDQAYETLQSVDDGFLRDKDGHYYTAHAIIYADSSRQPNKQVYKTKQEREEETLNAIETYIRQNRSED